MKVRGWWSAQRGPQLVQVASALLACGPVGGQDVGQLGSQAAGVAELAVAQDLLGHHDERVGPALPGGAGVQVLVAAGERFQGGEERFAVLGARRNRPNRLPSSSRRWVR